MCVRPVFFKDCSCLTIWVQWAFLVSSLVWISKKQAYVFSIYRRCQHKMSITSGVFSSKIFSFTPHPHQLFSLFFNSSAFISICLSASVVKPMPLYLYCYHMTVSHVCTCCTCHRVGSTWRSPDFYSNFSIPDDSLHSQLLCSMTQIFNTNYHLHGNNEMAPFQSSITHLLLWCKDEWMSNISAANLSQLTIM